MPPRARLLAIAAIYGTLLSGCGSEDAITTYRVPKEEAPRPAQAGPQAPSPGMTATPEITAQAQAFAVPEWTAPDGWDAQPLGSIRKGSWKVSGDEGSVDIAVTAFPGNVGGLLANVNRWRQQIGLEPVDQAGLESSTVRIAVDALPSTSVILHGTSGLSIAGAIVPKGEGTWFYKMSGDTQAIEAQLPAFWNFLESVKYPQAQDNQERKP